MKKKIIAAVLVVVLLIGGTGLFYISGIGHVSSKSEVVQVTVKKGENADLLKMFNEGHQKIRDNGKYDEIIAEYE